jgi:hypothetical protein
MNELSHRNDQNLSKVGPIFSQKDEKQRIISEEILNLRLKPQLKLNINMNIQGLRKKNRLSAYNPPTTKWIFHVLGIGREGWSYYNTMPNAIRFWAPLVMMMFYYYAAMPVGMQVHQQRHDFNHEFETAYFKFQTISQPFIEKISFMA